MFLCVNIFSLTESLTAAAALASASSDICDSPLPSYAHWLSNDDVTTNNYDVTTNNYDGMRCAHSAKHRSHHDASFGTSHMTSRDAESSFMTSHMTSRDVIDDAYFDDYFDAGLPARDITAPDEQKSVTSSTTDDQGFVVLGVDLKHLMQDARGTGVNESSCYFDSPLAPGGMSAPPTIPHPPRDSLFPKCSNRK